MVNRLIEPTSGRILLDGVDAATRDVTELRRGIGYVIQQTGPVPAPDHRGQRRDRAAAPRLAGGPAARASRGAARAGRPRPGVVRKRYPAQLSGGERQRVGVARALAADPPIMLMDEPFGAVDPIVRERLQNEFLRLQEQLAKTILFVTHDIDEAIKLGDLVAVFRDGGVVEQFGPPSEILAAPASDFVARFVGRRPRPQAAVADARERPRARAGGDRARRATTRRRSGAGRRPTRSGTCSCSTRRTGPLGWVGEPQIPASGGLTAGLVEGTFPLLDRRTTLKDALSMLLDDDVQAGVVVDRRGTFRGLVRVEQIAAFMRDTAREAPAARPRDRTTSAPGTRASRDRLVVDGGPPRRPRRPPVPAPVPGGDRDRRRLRDLVRPVRLGGPPAPRLRRRSPPSPGSCTRSRASRCSPRSSRSPACRCSPPRSRSSCTRCSSSCATSSRLRFRACRRRGVRRRDGIPRVAAAVAGRAAARDAARRRRAARRVRLDDRAGRDHGGDRRPVRRARLLHLRGLAPLLPDRDAVRGRARRCCSRWPSTSRSCSSSGARPRGRGLPRLRVRLAEAPA